MQRIPILIALLFASFFCASQDFKFSRYTEVDGLPSNNVRCFLKDRNGFMWVGTTRGLCKFDGKTFQHYSRKQGIQIPDDFINALFQDSEGLIWIGTNSGGVSVLDPISDKIKNYQFESDNPNSIAGDRVRQITQCQNGFIWVGFDNALGLSKIDKASGNITNYDPFAHIPRKGINAIREIVADSWRPDTLWLGTTNGLIAFDIQKEKFSVIHHPLEAKNRHSIFALHQIDENRIIGGFFHAGTDIFNISKKTWELKYDDSEDKTRVFDIARKSDDQYWLAARKKGLAELDINSNTINFVNSDMKNFESPFPGFNYTVYSTNDGLWVGSEHGISYYDTDIKTFPFESLYFSRKELGRIMTASGKYQKVYMVGVYGEGILEIDKNTGETIVSKNGSLNGFTNSMLELEDRIILVNNLRELELFDKKTRKTKQLEVAKYLNSGYELMQIHPWTDAFALLLTKHHGVFKLNLENYEILRLFDHGEENVPIYRNALVDNFEKMYFATSNNVVIYNFIDKSVSYYAPKSVATQKNKSIFSIGQDNTGAIWLGTVNGLIKWENGEELHISNINSDLPSDSVYEILFDNSGNIWVGTDAGVSKINLETYEISNYSSIDGLNYAGALVGIDEQILVGSYGGYSLFHPDSIDLSFDVPEIHFTSFKVANQEWKLEKNINHTQQINLQYHENFISFGFTVPSFSRQDKMLFEYKLEGLDENWIQSAFGNEANYTNLDGGNYTFQVKVKNRNGDWSYPRSVNVSIASPFWETWWFFTLCATGILAFSLVFHKSRIAILKQRAEHEAQELRMEALKNRFMELHASPAEMSVQLDFEELNQRLNTPLTQREFDVLKLSIQGKTNAEIAESAYISVNTVKYHTRNIYSKIGVSNRKEAFQYILKKS